MKHGYAEFKIPVPAGCGNAAAERMHHDARLRGASSGGIPALGTRTRLCPLGRAHRPHGLGKLARELLRSVTQTGRNNLIDTGAEHGIF